MGICFSSDFDCDDNIGEEDIKAVVSRITGSSAKVVSKRRQRREEGDQGEEEADQEEQADEAQLEENAIHFSKQDLDRIVKNVSSDKEAS